MEEVFASCGQHRVPDPGGTENREDFESLIEFFPEEEKGLHRIWDFVSLTLFVLALGCHKDMQSTLVD